MHQAGRPAKPKRRGRPSATSTLTTLKAIANATPPATINPLYLGEYIFPSTSSAKEDLECPVCHQILCQPVQLVECDNLICSSCCKEWVQASPGLPCPCCHVDHPCLIHPPSKVVLSLLGNLLIRCSTVKAGNHIAHLANECRECLKQMPTAPSDERVASTVIRRLLSESEDGATISVSTQGKVIVN